MKRIGFVIMLLGLLAGCSDMASGLTGAGKNGVGVSADEAATLARTDNPKATQRMCGAEEYNKFEKLCDKRDDQVYSYAKLGGVKWMTENLNYDIGDGSMCYGASSLNCDTYGRLYYWDAAMEACPEDWRLPSDADWQALELFAGMDPLDTGKAGWRGDKVGKALKSTSALWLSDGAGTNSAGFAVLPGGYYRGAYYRLGTEATFWTSTILNDKPVFRDLDTYRATVYRNTYGTKMAGFSVRCVKNDDDMDDMDGEE